MDFLVPGRVPEFAMKMTLSYLCGELMISKRVTRYYLLVDFNT